MKQILISYILSTLIMSAIGLSILQSFASSVCIHSEERPVRYETSFWGKQTIETTPSKADDWTIVCLERYDADYWSPVYNFQFAAKNLEGVRET